MPGMTKPGADGVHETLRREAANPLPRRTPPKQRTDSADVADRVQPEWRCNAKPGDNDAAEGRSDSPAQVYSDAVRSDSRRKILPDNKQRHNRLPGRSGERAAGPDQEHEKQQYPGRYEAEFYQSGKYPRYDRDGGLNHYHEASLVDDVRNRAGGYREQEHRQAGRDLD